MTLDIANYDPKKRDVKELISDWKVLTTLFASAESGRNIKGCPRERVIELTQKLLSELDERKIAQNPDSMTPEALKLFAEATRMKTSLTLFADGNTDILDRLPDINLEKGAIGYRVENGSLTIVLRMKEPEENMKNNIIHRVSHLLSEEFGIVSAPPFSWEDRVEKPFTPLYNVVLQKVEPGVLIPLIPTKLSSKEVS